jgi:glycine cleavage system aminomethyltransferase T
MFHAEVVRRDGVAVGYVRAASYGHTLGGAVGLVMIEPKVTVDDTYLNSGKWEVGIARTLYPPSFRPNPFTIESIRIRARWKPDVTVA